MTTALVALAAALSVSAQEEAVVKREAGGPVLSIPDVFVTDQSGVRMKGVKSHLRIRKSKRVKRMYEAKVPLSSADRVRISRLIPNCV